MDKEKYENIKTLLEIKQVLDGNLMNTDKLLDTFASKIDGMIRNSILDICKDDIAEFNRIRNKLQYSGLLRWIFYCAIESANVCVANLNREKILCISQILSEYNPIIDDDIYNVDVCLTLKEPHRFIVNMLDYDIDLLHQVIDKIGENNIYFTIEDYTNVYDWVVNFIDSDNGTIFNDDSVLPF